MTLKSSGNESDAPDIRPLVAQRTSDKGPWIFGIVMVCVAGLLFYVLEARRVTNSSEALGPRTDPGATMISSPPPLAIPDPRLDPDQEYGVAPPVTPTMLMPSRAAPPTQSAPSGVALRTMPAGSPTVPPPSWQQPASQPSGPPTTPAGTGAGPTVVYDAGSGKGAGPQSDTQSGKERVLATAFQNPSSTVPKGTVIQAVLETALDSTRPGFARAIISRDVFSFDGSHILIPKGSRIIGDYKADLTLGQNRALIQWQRMMRPDGIMIELDSPSADPLGRAGVKGKVNSHFLDRFGGAILQSSLDIGVQLASRSATNGVVVYGLPGSVRGAAPTQTDNVRPTVTVKQGTSVSVFVARDLDFSTVAQ